MVHPGLFGFDPNLANLFPPFPEGFFVERCSKIQKIPKRAGQQVFHGLSWMRFFPSSFFQYKFCQVFWNFDILATFITGFYEDGNLILEPVKIFGDT